jgi:hypothetical protein
MGEVIHASVTSTNHEEAAYTSPTCYLQNGPMPHHILMFTGLY